MLTWSDRQGSDARCPRWDYGRAVGLFASSPAALLFGCGSSPPFRFEPPPMFKPGQTNRYSARSKLIDVHFDRIVSGRRRSEAGSAEKSALPPGTSTGGINNLAFGVAYAQSHAGTCARLRKKKGKRIKEAPDCSGANHSDQGDYCGYLGCFGSGWPVSSLL
jgi:hypothetical protein